jgi:hypothetical protein
MEIITKKKKFNQRVLKISSEIKYHKAFANKYLALFNSDSLRRVNISLYDGPAHVVITIDPNSEVCADALKGFLQKLCEHHVNERVQLEIELDQIQKGDNEKGQ